MNSVVLPSMIVAFVFGFLAGFVKGCGVGRRNAETAHRAIWKASQSSRKYK